MPRKVNALLIVLVAISLIVSACGLTTEPQVVEKTVKETVVVEQTVEVEKEVTKIVEVEKEASQEPIVIRAAHTAETDNIDPALGSGSIQLSIIYNIYESLVDYKPGTLELEPILASEWQMSDDLKTWTFKLREGVKFTDGAPFDAQAVKVNVERTREIGQARVAGFTNEVVELKTPDAMTVEFVLASSDPLL